MMSSVPRTGTAAVFAALSLVMVGGATTAAAAKPLWKVDSATLPAYLPPGGTGQYQLYVRNVSQTPSAGIVSVVDTLPLGVVAVAAGDLASPFSTLANNYWHCSGTQVVTCESDPAKLPSIIQDDWSGTAADSELKPISDSAPPIVINVSVSAAVASEAINEVQVSGGGAQDTTIRQTPTRFSAEPSPPGLQNFSLSVLNRDGTTDAQAGSHPYEMTTSFTVNSLFSGFPLAPVEGPVQAPKDIELELPVGLVGNDQVVGQCARAVFDAGITGEGSPTCAADSQVGTATLGLAFTNLRFTLPVYNLTHAGSVPAEFGFGFEHHRAIIDAGVRTGDGYGLRVNLGDLEGTVRLDSSSITLWGEPADPSHNPDRCFTTPTQFTPCGQTTSLPRRPLLTLPSSCGAPLTQTLKVDYWSSPGAFESYTTSATDDHGNALPLTGCERLDFSPSLTLRQGVSKADSPTGLTVDLHVPQNETPEGLAESDLEGATVAFPAGLTVNPSAADGLTGCSPAQIGLDNASVSSCPDASKIGTVAIETPLLASPLRGAVYLAEQTNNPFGSLLAIYIEAEAEGGIIVKIAGHVIANAATGQLTAVFDDSPPLPFGDLRLELFGGPRAPLVTPASCGTYSTSTDFVGYDGTLASFASPFSISSGCGGGFAPSFAAGVTGTAQAGAFAPFTLRFTRNDEDQLLGGIQLHTPPGLLGALSSVPLCPEPQAQQGTCGPQSLIGHTTVGVGAGEEPYYIHAGQVFLTGPYRGAPFGLSIAVPAVAGPFNLGTVVVRASISVDPNTSQLTITSDPLPQIVQGIPILLRSVEVAVDRPDFMFNPTSCAPLAITATLTGSLGASAPVSSPFQATNCASLAFKPGFHVSTQGHTSKADGASLDVKLTYPPGSFGTAANIAKVKVDLPKQLPSRLTTLQKACPDSTFDVNPGSCPAGSVVGIARASTPVLPVAPPGREATPPDREANLTGPAYFVSHGGAKFPELIVVLQGDGVRVDLGGETFISKAGITSSTFATVPDVPVSSFELYLPEGPHSALGTNANLCTSKLAMPTAFTAQNGAVIHQSTKLTVTGCAKPKRTPKGKKARRAGSARHGRSA